MRRITLALAALVCGLGVTSCDSAPPPADLVIGDSNTTGASWATLMGPGCAPDVWAWGGVGVFTAGYGAGGITLANHSPTILAGHQGAHVVVMLGTNDALRTTAAIPTAAQLNTMSAQLVADGAASVRWMTLPPLGPEVSSAQRLRLAAWNLAILDTPNVIDVRSALGTTLDPAEQVGDGIHLSPAGHGAVAYVAAGAAPSI